MMVRRTRNRALTPGDGENDMNTTTPTTPPDPEGQNDSRADWAASALHAFMLRTGTDQEDAVSDLLCDLMHWCDRNGQHFPDELGRACVHYDAETESEGKQDTIIEPDADGELIEALKFIGETPKHGEPEPADPAYKQTWEEEFGKYAIERLHEIIDVARAALDTANRKRAEG